MRERLGCAKAVAALYQHDHSVTQRSCIAKCSLLGSGSVQSFPSARRGTSRSSAATTSAVALAGGRDAGIPAARVLAALPVQPLLYAAQEHCSQHAWARTKRVSLAHCVIATTLDCGTQINFAMLPKSNHPKENLTLPPPISTFSI